MAEEQEDREEDVTVVLPDRNRFSAVKPGTTKCFASFNPSLQWGRGLHQLTGNTRPACPVISGFTASKQEQNK